MRNIWKPILLKLKKNSPNQLNNSYNKFNPQIKYQMYINKIHAHSMAVDINAKYAENNLIKDIIYKRIWPLIQETNHIHAWYVVRLSLEKMF